jgi:hypothetical protein
LFVRKEYYKGNYEKVDYVCDKIAKHKCRISYSDFGGIHWDFPEDTYGLHWNRWKKGTTSQKKRSHYIGPGLLKHFLSSNESNDRKPFDYQHAFAEAVLMELAKMAVSAVQPTQSRIPFPFSPMSSMQSPMGNYNADPAANL